MKILDNNPSLYKQTTSATAGFTNGYKKGQTITKKYR